MSKLGRGDTWLKVFEEKRNKVECIIRSMDGARHSHLLLFQSLALTLTFINIKEWGYIKTKIICGIGKNKHNLLYIV